MTTLTKTETLKKSDMVKAYFDAKTEFDKLTETAKSHKLIMENMLNMLVSDMEPGTKEKIGVPRAYTAQVSAGNPTNSVSWAKVVESIRPLLPDDMQALLQKQIDAHTSPAKPRNSIKKV